MEGATSFRPDIEGLRAVAVLAVVAYHADLGPFPGGYVGVDVFFVVSGFLITTVLLRDIEVGGARALPGFWARRARRLLPASTLVVVSTLVAARFLLDPIGRRALGHDAVDAAVFVVNLVFIHRQSDYLAAQLAPSPLLHFWSLAVEEQFYVVWPFVLLLATRVRRHRRLVLLVVIGACAALSLAACVWYTDHHQPVAFFSLPTRAWELLAGAVLAALGSHLARLPRVLRFIAGWGGLAAIAWTVTGYGDRTVFPGWAATVPVAATVSIVAAGVGAPGVRDVRGTVGRVLGRAPLQWIGRRSYAIYLWHWPALTLAAARFGPLAGWQRAASIGVAVVLAAISFRLVEDPVRRARWATASPRRGLVLGAGLVLTSVTAGLAVVALPARVDGGDRAATATLATLPSGTVASTRPAPTIAAPATTWPEPSSTSAAPVSTDAPTTVGVGPSALDQLIAINAGVIAQGAATAAVPSNLRPGLYGASADLPDLYRDGCILSDGTTALSECAFGDPTSSTTVVLFGDSHAAQWFPAMQTVATAHHWRLEVLTKKGCPTATLELRNRQRNRECAPWRDLVEARLALERPALVVMSAYRYNLAGPDASLAPDDAWRRGLDVTVAAIRDSTTQLLLLGDTPTPRGDVPSCVAGHLRDVTACTASRSRAVKDARLAVEADIAVAHHAVAIATGDWLCTATTCPVIIGDLLMYRDDSHLTATASLWLAPFLDAALTPLVG